MMEQIDALRAMLADATPGEWEFANVYSGGVKVASFASKADARLIAAMHNAMPALLDAAEMVEAMEWAEEWGVKEYDYHHQDGLDRPCDSCPMLGDMCRGSAYANNPCHNVYDYHRAWKSAYREREGE